jgi:peptidoglycan-associated lipoprotein
MKDAYWIRWAGIALLVIGIAVGCGKKRAAGPPPTGGPLEPGESRWTESTELHSRDVDGVESPFIPPIDMLQIEENGFPAPGARAPIGPKMQVPDLETVYFDFDASTIRPDQEWVLRSNAEYLLNHLDVHVEVQGHCDERGTEEYNLALGDRRALAIRAYLSAAGVEPARVYTISYGEAVPAVDGQSEEAYSQNRRAEFWIISQ